MECHLKHSKCFKYFSLHSQIITSTPVFPGSPVVKTRSGLTPVISYLPGDIQQMSGKQRVIRQICSLVTF